MSDRSVAPDAAPVDHDPFAGGALLRVVPTTEPQREVWLADRLGDNASLAYNEACALRLVGALDATALGIAVQGLVDRHDALRSTVGADGETLCIGASFDVAMSVSDLAALTVAQRAARVEAHQRHAVDTPFALDAGPLFRASLLRLDAGEHLLILAAHHIVCDGWSWWLMVRELADLYAAAIGDGDGRDALPAPAAFADYALAQARRGRDLQAIEDARYWVGRFADDVPTLDLPLDRPRPPRRTFASAREDVAIDAELLAQVRQLGARRGASLFATLLGGFATLLSRLSGQSRVVIGIPAAGQSVDGHDQVVGHCVNLLPLRFDIDPSQPMTALVDAAQDTLLDAMDHQRMTFGTLLRHLRVDRDPSRLPLVSVMFNIDQALDRDAQRFPGVSADFAGLPRSHENFELSVNAVQRDGGLVLECQYNTALFDRATVRRWLRALDTLLRQAVRAPDAAIGTLSMLDAGERALLAALQPAPTAYDRGCAMHQLFERQCDRSRDRIAVHHRDRAWTYAELDARANRIAALLRAQGVHADALVGLALERGADMLAALLGILKTGAGYVPLDPAFPRERLVYMVGDAGLAALVTQTSLADSFDLRGRPVLALDALDDALAAASPARVAQPLAADAIAYVIYTSGSTGKPKGVQVPHGAVANFITAMQARPGIAADDVLVAVTTLSFDIAVLELMLPLSAGACVVIADRDVAMDGMALSTLLHDARATLMQATPSTWRVLVESGWQGGPAFRALCGGEPLPVDLAQALLARSGETWNLYGPTETTVWSTCWRVVDPARGVSIGTPIANTTVWVMDAQGQPCPLGVPGELCIGGDGVTRGYLGRDDLTAEKFIADPFVAADAAAGGAAANGTRAAARLYRTGDRGRWRADGTLEHLGRLDFQVKVRGYRIELGEIEAALSSLPGVAQSLAVVREDRADDVRIVGYVVAQAGTAFDDRAAIDALRSRLPAYMLPQHVVALAALPLLPNGKIDRAALPAPLVGGAPVAVVTREPRSDLERAIAAAMRQLLGAPTFGIDDDFFAHGGHSLLAAQLTTRLNRELGLGLTLRALFDAPTVTRLAALAQREDGVRAPERIARRDDRVHAPLSPMQDWTWMLSRLAPERLTDSLPVAWRLRGTLDVDAFVRAFDAVAQQQAVLRTSIVEIDGEPLQRVHDRVESGLRDVIDLRALPQAAREAEAQRQMTDTVLVPLSLTDAPLFRARLYRLDEAEHLLFFMPHHAIFDGWSFELFHRLMSRTYAAFERGEPSPLEPMPVSYGDFAAWYRASLAGPEQARQRAFWQRHLRGDGSPMRALPTDHPRRADVPMRPDRLPIRIPRPLVDRLHASAVALDSTLFVLLYSAYYALVAEAVGGGDVVIATPVRGRNTEQTEGLMGFFTNLLPLRVAVDAQASFATLAATVKSAVLDGLVHPEVRIDELMREVRIGDDSGPVAIFHAQFSFYDVRRREMQWGGLEIERVEIAVPDAPEEFGLLLIESVQGLAGMLHFNAAVFDAATAQRVVQRLLALLDALADDPRRSVAQLLGGDARTAPVPTSAHTVTVDARDTLTVPRSASMATAATIAPTPQAPAPTLESTATAPASEATAIVGPAAHAAIAPAAIAHAAIAPAAIAHAGIAREIAPIAAVAPTRDDLARMMSVVATIWSDVLGVAQAAPEDDFFAHGGHSLHAVRLLHRLGRETGVNLPLATLLTASTVRGLAQASLAAGGRLPDVGIATAPQPMDPWRPLVLIRPGVDPAPLFFIHAVGGNVLNYRPLAMQMPPGIAVYGLQAFGLDGRTPPLTSIEAMAARYIDDLRRVQPHGPYHLAGGSMGGMIAYEMAQQLVAAGETVALLALIDTSSTWGQRLRREAAGEVSRWRQLRERLRGKSPWQALREVVERVLLRQRTRREHRRITALRARGEEIPHALRHADLAAAHLVAYREYVVQPYPGVLTLFRANPADRSRTVGVAADPALGWTGIAARVEAFNVDGNHHNIVEAPALAGALCESVQRARLRSNDGARAPVSPRDRDAQGLRVDAPDAAASARHA